jgi:hypothetical protein
METLTSTLVGPWSGAGRPISADAGELTARVIANHKAAQLMSSEIRTDPLHRKFFDATYNSRIGASKAIWLGGWAFGYPVD